MEVRGTARAGASGLIAMAVVCCVLQVGLSPQFSILGGRINFMLVLALTSSLSAEPDTAVYVGFFSGMFYDLTGSVPVGLMALVLTVASWLVATLSRGIAPGFTMNAMRLCIVFAFAVNLVYALALLALGVETSAFSALVGHGLAASVLDAVVSAPFLMLRARSQAPSAGTLGSPQRGSARQRGQRYKMKR